MSRIEMDSSGFPLLLADKKSEQVDVANNGTPGLHVPPSGIAPDEWARRHDAVREAAREFETFSTQDAREWIKSRTQRELTDIEVAQFVADVRQQVITDLVDALDQNERGILRSRRTVRVVAPKGYIKKTINALTDDEWQQVIARLKARSWTAAQVKALNTKHNRSVAAPAPTPTA